MIINQFDLDAKIMSHSYAYFFYKLMHKVRRKHHWQIEKSCLTSQYFITLCRYTIEWNIEEDRINSRPNFIRPNKHITTIFLMPSTQILSLQVIKFPIPCVLKISITWLISGWLIFRKLSIGHEHKR